ncbi:hypothetical protein ACFFX0_33380 [Citricoccus parietis]|uniref:Uncharacterized protein n=1 Tax=Citricoccus parietis TaxID=592307 RepID=A0ABV5GA14_9MICC
MPLRSREPRYRRRAACGRHQRSRRGYPCSDCLFRRASDEGSCWAYWFRRQASRNPPKRSQDPAR